VAARYYMQYCWPVLPQRLRSAKAVLVSGRGVVEVIVLSAVPVRSSQVGTGVKSRGCRSR
jgi:hypothetical protein